jgi:glycerol-3-phosphate dehydrogenase subunit B
MVAGDSRQPHPVLIVGFKQYLDFYPDLVADNLILQGIQAKGITVSIETLENRRFVNSMTLAALFEQADFRYEVVKAIQAAWKKPGNRAGDMRIGFPAVLGMNDTRSITKDLADQLGYPVFEIPTLPPSIPGMRLSHLLHKAIEKFGGQIFEGIQVVSSEIQNQHITTVWSEAASRLKSHSSDVFILATGGILGGGMNVDADGKIRETILNLGIPLPGPSQNWFSPQFLDPSGHSIFLSGINVDHNFRPIDRSTKPLYNNLFAVGTGLSGGDYIVERSWEGVALVSGYIAGKQAASG